MSQDEIIAMAREAGFRTGKIDLSIGEPVPFIAPASGTSCMVELERFAALVAAAEREACATACDAIYHQFIGPAFGEVRHGVAACAAAIRESGKP